MGTTIKGACFAQTYDVMPWSAALALAPELFLSRHRPLGRRRIIGANEQAHLLRLPIEEEEGRHVVLLLALQERDPLAVRRERDRSRHLPSRFGPLLIRSNVIGLASGPAMATRDEPPCASAVAAVGAGGGAAGAAGAGAAAGEQATRPASTHAPAARRNERFRVMVSE